VVSVPGQRTLAQRRLHIVETADVVVFVCSSALDDWSGARAMLKDVLRNETNVPLILQANKQDLEKALAPRAVSERLGLDERTPVVSACARDGSGVKETYAAAVRKAASMTERLLQREGLDGLAGRAEAAAELLAALKPYGAEPNALAQVDDDRARRIHSVAGASYGPPPSRPQWREDGSHDPPLPSHKVPAECIWPTVAGRRLLQELSTTPVTRREVLDGHAGRTVAFKVGAWRITTSLARRFGSDRAARAALIGLAQKKLLLGGLLAPGSAMSVQMDRDQRYWIWSLCPWMCCLSTELTWAEQHEDEATLARALEKYAHAVVQTLSLAARTDLRLDATPESFGCLGEEVFYVAELSATTHTNAAHALLAQIDAYPQFADACEAYLRSIETEIGTHLSADDVVELQLQRSLESAPVTSSRGRDARGRLSTVVAGLTRTTVEEPQ
jgi:hypothetical protein